MLVAAAVPAFALQLTPGSTFGIPRTPQSVQGFDVLQSAVGPGRGRAGDRARDRANGARCVDPAVEAAIGRLVAELKRDPEVAAVAAPPARPLRRPDAAATGRC